MVKGQFWSDTFEQLAELGKSTAKKTVKSVTKTFNPLEPLMNQGNESTVQTKQLENINKNNSHTPLDLDKLQKKYTNQDQAKADVLRNRLFQMIKSGEEKTLQEKKQKEEQKKYQELQEEEGKKSQLEQKKIQEQQITAPQGKERKSILGGKKKKGVNPQPTEIKPATGKQ